MGNAKSKQDKNSRLLWEAADKNDVPALRELLRKGASPNSFGGTQGWTALMVAAFKNHSSIACTLSHTLTLTCTRRSALPPRSLARSLVRWHST